MIGKRLTFDLILRSGVNGFFRIFLSLMMLGSSNLSAQLNSLVPLPNDGIVDKNNESNSHRIEQWELLEEDFVFGVVANEPHADHLREYDSMLFAKQKCQVF